MKDLNIGQTDHETRLFEEIKANLRDERDQALGYWQQIRKRYVYRGRQYSAQEVIDWFMSAPFMEAKAIGEELGIDWKTIGNDVRRIADPLRGFEVEKELLSGIKEPFVEDTGIYAKPRVIEDIEQCYFYHTIDLPGHGTIEGEWDLRDGINDYLGGVNFSGKRVLDVGTANGMICFETERQGGKVTAFDLSKDYAWDLVPYARWKDYAYISHGHRYHIESLNNAYWLCHRCLNSNAKAVYGDVYNIPEQIGEVDIVIYGSILLHLRDPFLALQSGTRLAREAVVVTEVLRRDRIFQSKEPYMKFLPDPETLEPKDTWWDLRPEFVVRVINVLGFEDIRVTYHSQLCKGEEVQLYTVVGRRTS
jgi:SAM-dependent methyltransferase